MVSVCMSEVSQHCAHGSSEDVRLSFASGLSLLLGAGVLSQSAWAESAPVSDLFWMYCNAFVGQLFSNPKICIAKQDVLQAFGVLGISGLG